MAVAAAYSRPFRASIVPVVLKRTIAARVVQSAAGPLARPTTPFMFAVVGVASNWASKAPAGDGIATFCQAPALVQQLGAVLVVVPRIATSVMLFQALALFPWPTMRT